MPGFGGRRQTFRPHRGPPFVRSAGGLFPRGPHGIGPAPHTVPFGGRPGDTLPGGIQLSLGHGCRGRVSRWSPAVFLHRQGRRVHGFGHAPLRAGQLGGDHPGLPFRLPGFRRQGHRADVRLWDGEEGGHGGGDHRRFVRPVFLAPDKTPGGQIGLAIEHPRDAVDVGISHPFHGIQPHLIGLEEGAQPVVIVLGDRVVFVVVALAAVHGQAEQTLAHVLHGFLHPGVPVEEEKVARQKPGGPDFFQIPRIQFIRGQHLPQHLIVRQARVEGLHDPVAPVPHVFLAVPELVAEAPPVAVTPDVHPMPRPAFAMPGVAEELLDNPVIPVR